MSIGNVKKATQVPVLLVLIVWLLIYMVSGGVAAQAEEMIEPASERDIQPKTSGSRQPVSIDFNDVDIHVLIKLVSEMTGKNFVVDPRVKGRVTIISPSKISIQEAYQVFESVLEVHGFTTVTAGKIIKIVPAPDARSKSIDTMLGKDGDMAIDKVVTQLIPLKYADSAAVKKLLSPLVSKNSVVLDYAPTNTLIITDVYSNIKRLQKIVEAIDVMGVGRELSILPLKYARANDLVMILQSVFTTQSANAKNATTADTASFVADERTNTLILLASRTDTPRIKELVAILDTGTSKGKEGVHVYYLENAIAEDLAKVLEGFQTKSSSSSSSKDPQKAPIISTDVIVKADLATNSLIIIAEKEDYLTLETIIQKLDIPRPMVYIECLIMEINVDRDFNMGTEWTAVQEIGNEGALGGGFSGQDPGYSNVTSLSSGSFPSGLSMGVFGESIEVNGVTFPSISAIVQAYKMDKDVHILSTPQLLTMDNEEASINVGENVPYQTRSAAESGTETYSSYEYRDVGTTLKITPQINKGGFVRLEIFEEMIKLDELATTTSERPTTYTRSIETTVIIKDRHTLVLGGLIDDSLSKTENRIPCLGDIPLLGWAFRTISESREKTNLYVFLTPYVIESEAEAAALLNDKQRLMDAGTAGSIKMYQEPVHQQKVE